MAHTGMNRRTWIGKVLASAAASGTVMSATVTEAAPAPFLLVLEAPGHIDEATVHLLTRSMEENLAGTAFGCVKIFVLGDGMTLKTIGADGRPLTHPVTVRAKRRPRIRRQAAPEPGAERSR
jgi:hypothetical protein